MTKKITPDWELELKKIELLGYGSVALMCDEYQTSWSIFRIRNTLKFIYYVEGVSKGNFLSADSEIGQKFGILKYQTMSAKTYNVLVKVYGKKYANAEQKRVKSTVILNTIFHPSAASVIRTLKRTCKEVKLFVEPPKLEIAEMKIYGQDSVRQVEDPHKF